MGDACRKWNHVTDSKRKRAAIFSSPPIQVMEAREGAQSNERSGPKLPHPSIEREALWPTHPGQRTLPEGTASWRENTPASVDAKGLGRCDPEVQLKRCPSFGVYAQPASAISSASLRRKQAFVSICALHHVVVSLLIYYQKVPFFCLFLIVKLHIYCINHKVYNSVGTLFLPFIA